jgi:hypothetical protein
MKQSKTSIRVVPALRSLSFDGFETSVIEDKFKTLADIEHEYMQTAKQYNSMLSLVNSAIEFVFDPQYLQYLPPSTEIIPVKIGHVLCLIREYDVIYVELLSTVGEATVCDTITNNDCSIFNTYNVTHSCVQVIDKLKWLHLFFTLKNTMDKLKQKLTRAESLFKYKRIIPMVLFVAKYVDGTTITRVLEQDSITFDLKFKTINKGIS